MTTSVPLQTPLTDQLSCITVVCVRFGSRYGIEYVERLRNMVARHLTLPYEFVCITDDSTVLPGVRNIVQPCASYKKMWWHKIHMFDPTLPIYGKILYFDLDVIIHQNINRLIVNNDQQLVGIRDFNRRFNANWNRLNSSALSWVSGRHSHIYSSFIQHSDTAMQLHGDQDWIWKIARDQIIFWPDLWIQSYKWEIRSKDELKTRLGYGGFSTISHELPDPACCVAVFHGEPKPQDICDPFVINNWC